MWFPAGIMNLDAIELDFVTEHQLRRRDAASAMCSRFGRMGTSNATQPSYRIQSFLLSPAQFQEPIQILLTWVSQTAVNTLKSHLDPLSK